MAGHLSRLEPNVTLVEEREIEEAFLDELVMMLSYGSKPWYADYAKYMVCGVVPLIG